MDVYEIGHINTTAENTMDKILKHKRIQLVNRCREMDLQNLKNYKLLGSRNLPFMTGWVEWFCWGSSYGYSPILFRLQLQSMLYSTVVLATARVILLVPQLQSLSYPLWVLVTAHVIFCWGLTHSPCYILFGPQLQTVSYSVGPLLQPMSYSGGVLGTSIVVFWWGPSYSQCYVLLGTQQQPVSCSVGVLVTANVIFCWGPRQCYILLAFQLQSHSYPVQAIAITSVLFFWGNSYSQGHVVGVLGVATVLPFGT